MIDQLKAELERHIGFSLDSFKHCRKLEKLLHERKIFVSDSSLARIFTVGNRTTQPRLATLNELCCFLGYPSLSEFIIHHDQVNEERKAYTRKVLEMKAELFSGTRARALKLFIEIRKEYHHLSGLLSQEFALHIFNSCPLTNYELDLIVDCGIADVDFIDFFVYEDDPQGNYESFLTRMAPLSHELSTFAALYKERKRLLRENCCQHLPMPMVPIEQSVHLYSRWLEIEVLDSALRKPNEIIDFFQERLCYNIDILKNRPSYDKLIVLGRLFRAACHTNIHTHIYVDQETKAFITNLINSDAVELEFMAPLYAVCVHDASMPLRLDFYHNNHWKNAQLESEMILSQALGLTEIHDKIKKTLFK